MGIRDYVKQISPPWLIGPGRPNVPPPEGAGVAERIIYAFGLGSDLIVEKIWEAIYMRFPGAGDPSSLAQNGADRKITRGFDESDDDYAARLRRWLDTWRHAGAARSVLEAIAGYVGVSPKIESILEGPSESVWDVITEGADPTLPPDTHHVDPANWTWDALAYAKRRWLVILDKNYSTGEAWVTATRKWGDGTVWGQSGVAWGVDIQSEIGASIREIIAAWKNAGTRYWWVIINFDPSNFGYSAPPGDSTLPDPTFENWSKIDTSGVRPVRVRSRFTTARYFQGPRS